MKRMLLILTLLTSIVVMIGFMSKGVNGKSMIPKTYTLKSYARVRIKNIDLSMYYNPFEPYGYDNWCGPVDEDSLHVLAELELLEDYFETLGGGYIFISGYYTFYSLVMIPLDEIAFYAKYDEYIIAKDSSLYFYEYDNKIKYESRVINLLC